MDTVTARDYIHTYPRINAILTDYYPKPRFGFSDGDIYTILEEALAIRDSRIAELTELVLAVEDYCGEPRTNMVDGEFWFDKRDKLLP